MLRVRSRPSRDALNWHISRVEDREIMRFSILWFLSCWSRFSRFAQHDLASESSSRLYSWSPLRPSYFPFTRSLEFQRTLSNRYLIPVQAVHDYHAPCTTAYTSSRISVSGSPRQSPPRIEITTISFLIHCVSRCEKAAYGVIVIVCDLFLPVVSLTSVDHSQPFPIRLLFFWIFPKWMSWCSLSYTILPQTIAFRSFSHQRETWRLIEPSGSCTIPCLRVGEFDWTSVVKVPLVVMARRWVTKSNASRR